MKALGSAQKLYWNERCEVDGPGQITTFAQLMGLQAVHIGDMIQSRRKNDMPGVLNHWTRMVKLNNKWVNLVMMPFASSPHVDEDTLCRMKRVASDMSQGYSSTIAQLIIDGNVDTKKLQSVIEAEARFFSVILGTPVQIHPVHNDTRIEEETRRHWFNHTGSVIGLMHIARMGDAYCDDQFHYAAANCIIHGKLLGSWLDGVFLGK